MVFIELQYIEGCPHSDLLISRTREAVNNFEGEINYKEILFENNETAEKLKFRGSPTLLINNIDFEELPEIESPGLTCRYYSNGLPSTEEILDVLRKYTSQ